MQYKKIILEMLEQRTELHKRLRQERKLLTTIETYAKDLRANHDEWKATLSEVRPGRDPMQIASEAMEMAIEEMEVRLHNESQDHETLSLDEAMAFIRDHTSRG